jgi:ABC-type multidrug transport system fused ATPase/permease subunit
MPSAPAPFYPEHCEAPSACAPTAAEAPVGFDTGPERDIVSSTPRRNRGVCGAIGSGLDTLIGEGGVKVSGGEKQRLSIARALLRRPLLLVFDEATSSLDSLTEEEISQTIRDIGASRDAITILIAHRLSTVPHADRIHVLERGGIVEFGRHAELLANKGLVCSQNLV